MLQVIGTVAEWPIQMAIRGLPSFVVATIFTTIHGVVVLHCPAFGE